MTSANLTGWTVVSPGARTSYRTLAQAYLAGIRHHSPVLRDGKEVTVSAARVGGRVALTAWWAK